MSLIKDPGNIRLAMLGMVDGNGHPYSWSAIVNGGFDPAGLAESPYPLIGAYLGAQPKEALGIPGVKVTHIWCDDPKDAQHVAKTVGIPQIVARPEDVIGQVDAVVIPTDKGGEHVDRCRPFIDAGLPVFIDKPMVDREDHLRQFVAWQRAGHPLMSSSCMRYAREYQGLRSRLQEIGELRLIVNTTCKSWERYGIHALEAAYPFAAPGGWEWVTNTGSVQANVVHAHHASGVDLVLAAVSDMYGAFGKFSMHGTKGSLHTAFDDTFFAFKTQLEDFIKYLRTGQQSYPFAETVEQMKIIIAGIRSREEGGRRVYLRDISA